MKKLQNKIALITGASSGIGEAVSLAFAAEGAKCILLARNAEKLDALKARTLNEGGAEPVTRVCDVRDKKQIDGMLASLPEGMKEPDILVNNAGMARGLDLIQDGKPEDWDEMIDTNVKGLLYVTNAFLPAMIRRGTGHIINLGSTAGHDVYAKGNVYCATKFAVNALSQAFRIDLLEHGIRVTSVDPGLVETNFSMVRFSGDEKRAKSIYSGIEALTPADVADTVLFAATRPPNVNINEIIMTPLKQASNHFIIRKQQ